MTKTQFEAVAHRKDGSFALACSSLTGHQWDGNLWVFKSMRHYRECSNLFLSNTRTTTGISDILWLADEKNLLLATDSGALEVWSDNDPLGGALELRGALTVHDDMALCVCRLGSGTGGGDKVVSGGADGRVIVSDIDTMKLLRNYKGHMDMVLSVAASPAGLGNVFFTSSKDGSVRLWDLRLPQPARNVTACSTSVVHSSLAWGKDTLALGSERGVVEVLDVRDDTHFLFASYPLHRESIHRMTFAPWDLDLLATISEDTSVHIHCVSKNKTVYDNSDHVDFVRGASWDPDPERRGLLTCGWDGHVLWHDVPHLPAEDVASVAVGEVSTVPLDPDPNPDPVSMETEPQQPPPPKEVVHKNGFVLSRQEQTHPAEM